MNSFSFFLCFFFVSAVSSTGLAENIENVNICAAACGSEILGESNHGDVTIGRIYYAPDSEVNRTNIKTCLANAKYVDVTSELQNQNSLNTCIQALRSAFLGKKVSINTKFAREETDVGTYFAIIESDDAVSKSVSAKKPARRER